MNRFNILTIMKFKLWRGRNNNSDTVRKIRKKLNSLKHGRNPSDPFYKLTFNKEARLLKDRQAIIINKIMELLDEIK